MFLAYFEIHTSKLLHLDTEASKIENKINELAKSGKKIIELPYVHPPDVEGMSKTATNILRFC